MRKLFLTPFLFLVLALAATGQSLQFYITQWSCNNGNIQLEADYNPNWTYNWYGSGLAPGASITPNGNQAVVYVPANTDGDVYCDVTDGTNYGSNMIYVLHNPTSPVNWLEYEGQPCGPGPVRYIAQWAFGTNNINVSWSIVGGTMVHYDRDSWNPYNLKDTLVIDWHPGVTHQINYLIFPNVNPYICATPYSHTITPVCDMEGPDSICAGDIATYRSYCGPGATFAWSSGNGTLLSPPGADSAVFVWTAAMLDTVQVIYNDVTCGLDTAYFPITVSGGAASLITGPDSLCAQATDTFQVIPQPGHFYSWVVNNGTISGSATGPVLVATAGNGPTMTVSVQDSFGVNCPVVDSKSVVVDPFPVISGVDSTCANATEPFSVANSPGHNYTWQLNGGAFLSGNTGATIAAIAGNGASMLVSLQDTGTSCIYSTSKSVFLLPTSLSSAVVSICPGDSAFLGGGWQTIPGTYNDTLTGANGCDSVLTTTLAILSTSSGSASASICFGDSIFLGGNWQMSAGSFIDTLTGSNGCDSIMTTSLSISSLFNLNAVAGLCQGDSIFLAGGWQTAVGTYLDTLPAVVGCDTVLTTTVSILAITSGSAAISLCPGDSAFLGGSWQTLPGAYNDTLTGANGCDSVLTTTLSILPTSTGTASTAICPGDSAFLGGGWQNLPGSFNDTLTGANGCDSILTTTLSYFADYTVPLSDSICNGDSAFLGGAWQLTSGIFYDTLVTVNGCDSVLVTTLNVISDCVWPGDSDNNGVADNNDFLAVGVTFGSSGTPRANASTNWEGQPATDWGPTLPGNVDYKHTDADGNGTVNYQDTLPISAHYGFTHNRLNGTSSGVPLYFVPLQQNWPGTDTVVMDIYLGDQFAPVTGAYGLAFTIIYPVPQVNANTFKVDFPYTFLGTAGQNRMDFKKGFISAGQEDVATVRTDQQSVNGYGPVARMKFRVNTGVWFQNPGAPLYFLLVNAKLIDAQGDDIDIAPRNDTILIYDPNLQSTASPNSQVGFTIYPNPAEDDLNIVLRGLPAENTRLSIMNAQGQTIHAQSLCDNNCQGETYRISTFGLAAGMYFVRLENGAWQGTRIVTLR